MFISNVILRQLNSIRLSGKTNMFDKNTVQYYANAADFYELVVFIQHADDAAYVEALTQMGNMGDIDA